MRLLISALVSVSVGLAFASGPYTDPGISRLSPRIVGWASGVSELVRGSQDLSNPSAPLANFGSGAAGLGAASGISTEVVSLGDGGWITLTFDKAIRNGVGTDFAVFENGFAVGSEVYAELGHVEVSSNGSDFFRFASVSLTPTANQIGGFSTLDPTNVSNLAGKHVAGIGTEFDLDQMVGVSSLLDVNNITHVRIIDVVGSINPNFGSRDSLGNLINDPFTTPFASGGFDLDGVAVMNAVPEPMSLVALVVGAGIMARRRKSKA
ncbi:MAG: PEP-CTERM sorting domain-containing protein [Fimbriimonadaceae bacterium]|jgi:hypothetical protein|nr:PEP-CTERM sorting domain-containing protein [Fimbriimonadaceae bacterium]